MLRRKLAEAAGARGREGEAPRIAVNGGLLLLLLLALLLHWHHTQPVSSILAGPMRVRLFGVFKFLFFLEATEGKGVLRAYPYPEPEKDSEVISAAGGGTAQ